MDPELEATPIWLHFAEKADVEKRARMESLIGAAASILDRIVETFPTYTLHNRVHARNVVGRMGDLLGPAVSQLTALEAALLLLSAYYHDIGMYYKRDELAVVAQEEFFELFLRNNPDSYVRFVEAGHVPDERLIEDYCRWRHADRVYEFLNERPPDELTWGVVSLTVKLGELCRSHNRDHNFLRRDDVFETAFIEECDLRFCAILLRLADILDFDASRTPEFVFAHLGLATATTDELKTSQAEWRKHQSAQGFKFPSGERRGLYSLPFVAGPDDPAVEHDLREFLGTIEDEFLACSVLLQSCSARWRDLALPHDILARIQSQNYRYGEYRFALDRHHVLNLFMGESLYGQPYVFLRELLQNAVDTTRHRLVFERTRGRHDFEPQPIDVTAWVDAESYHWVRVDDGGMGMDETLILEYFLSVGRSYYTSSRFRADMLRYRADALRFTPVSRFGIGVLSCFIIGDRVEVSTRQAGSHDLPGRPIRLSLRGLESFYVLQTPEMKPNPMPGASGFEAYRADVGTSIAVRLDPSKEGTDPDLLTLLNRFVLACPVPVTYHRRPVSSAAERIVATPWTDGVKSSPVSPLPPYFGEYIVGTVEPPAEAQAIPLDLTAVSPDKRFRGQMAILAYPMTDPAYDPTESRVAGGRWLLRNRYDQEDPDVTLRLADLLGEDVAAVLQSSLTWSYNGIVLPEAIQFRGLEDGEMIEAKGPVGAAMFARPYYESGVWRERHRMCPQFVGCWAFSDELTIDLSASRDVVQNLPWRIYSIMQLSVVRAVAAAEIPLAVSMLETGIVPFALNLNTPTMAELLDDPLVTSEDGWRKWPIMSLMADRPPDASSYATDRNTYHALAEITRMVEQRGTPVVLQVPSFTEISARPSMVQFRQVITAGLAQINLGVSWGCDKDGRWRYLVTSPEPAPTSEIERNWPPLYIVPYIGSAALRMRNGPLNRSHAFVAWLGQAGSRLAKEHPSMFRAIVKGVADPYQGMDDVLADRVASVNAALERLRREGFPDGPPLGLRIRVDDFVT